MTKQYQIKITLMASKLGHEDYDPQSTYGDESASDFLKRWPVATSSTDLVPHFSIYSRDAAEWVWVSDFIDWDEAVKFLSDKVGRSLDLHPQWTQDITV